MANRRDSDESVSDREHVASSEDLDTPVRDPNTSAPAPGDVVLPIVPKRRGTVTVRELEDGALEEDSFELRTDGAGDAAREKRVAAAEAELEAREADDSDSSEAETVKDEVEAGSPGDKGKV